MLEPCRHNLTPTYNKAPPELLLTYTCTPTHIRVLPPYMVVRLPLPLAQPLQSTPAPPPAGHASTLTCSACSKSCLLAWVSLRLGSSGSQQHCVSTACSSGRPTTCGGVHVLCACVHECNNVCVCVYEHALQTCVHARALGREGASTLNTACRPCLSHRCGALASPRCSVLAAPRAAYATPSRWVRSYQCFAPSERQPEG